MNPNGLAERVKPAAIAVAGIAIVTIAVLALTDRQFPGLLGQLNLSVSGIGQALSGQVTAFRNLTGLSPLTDFFLFVGAYVLVCVFLWLQEEIRTYLSNRSHFEE